MAMTTVPGKHVDIKMWTRTDEVEAAAMAQLRSDTLTSPIRRP